MLNHDGAHTSSSTNVNNLLWVVANVGKEVASILGNAEVSASQPMGTRLFTGSSTYSNLDHHAVVHFLSLLLNFVIGQRVAALFVAVVAAVMDKLIFINAGQGRDRRARDNVGSPPLVAIVDKFEFIRFLIRVNECVRRLVLELCILWRLRHDAGPMSGSAKRSCGIQKHPALVSSMCTARQYSYAAENSETALERKCKIGQESDSR